MKRKTQELKSEHKAAPCSARTGLGPLRQQPCARGQWPCSPLLPADRGLGEQGWRARGWHSAF